MPLESYAVWENALKVMSAALALCTAALTFWAAYTKEADPSKAPTGKVGKVAQKVSQRFTLTTL